MQVLGALLQVHRDVILRGGALLGCWIVATIALWSAIPSDPRAVLGGKTLGAQLPQLPPSPWQEGGASSRKQAQPNAHMRPRGTLLTQEPHRCPYRQVAEGDCSFRPTKVHADAGSKVGGKATHATNRPQDLQANAVAAAHRLDVGGIWRIPITPPERTSELASTSHIRKPQHLSTRACKHKQPHERHCNH